MKGYELALKAGRLRQSPVTHFIHANPENPERAWDSIPLYENFCFILALFRAKTAESILEGKALLERLFAFKTDEGFPLYLHEYPLCRSHRLASKLSIAARFLLRDFNPILGESLKEKLRSMVIPFEEGQIPTSPEECADYLIESQLSGKVRIPVLAWWDSKALCFRGPQKQDKGEPAVTLYDLIAGEWGGTFSKRALIDHPVHLQASLIYPQEEGLLTSWQPSKKQSRWARNFWGDGNPTHSAVLSTQGAIVEKGDTIEIHLPSKTVHDEVEVSYFLNKHSPTHFSVQGIRSTTFQLGETIEVQSGAQNFQMVFSRLQGRGRFWGHLYCANRPGQIGCKGVYQHEAFDWVLGLRTVEREDETRLKIEFRLMD